jgi:TonB family protein
MVEPLRFKSGLLAAAALSLLVGVGCAQAGTFTPVPSGGATLIFHAALDTKCQDSIPDGWEPEEMPGDTVLTVRVGRDGSVRDAQVSTSSGSMTLDSAAISCVRNLGAIFNPAHQGALPIEAWSTLTVSWTNLYHAWHPPKAFFSNP